jgi:hypothetical protein
MNLPNFSADSSIYRRAAPYRTALAWKAAANRYVPATHRPPNTGCGDCIWDSYDYSVPTRAQICFDPVVGSYPTPCDPSQCPVTCGRCLSYISGRFQYCKGGGYGAGQWVSCSAQKGR